MRWNLYLQSNSFSRGVPGEIFRFKNAEDAGILPAKGDTLGLEFANNVRAGGVFGACTEREIEIIVEGISWSLDCSVAPHGLIDERLVVNFTVK